MADGTHDSRSTHFISLAEDSFAQIRLCGCDMVHLGVGPVTLRLSMEAFSGLAGRMQEALRQLERLTGSKAPTLTVVQN